MKRYRWLISILATLLLFSSCTTLKEVEQDPMAVLRREVLDTDGEMIPIEAEHLLLYYAANWCPFCVESGEQLNEQYRALKRLYGDAFELIFIGHINDEDDEELISYLQAGKHPFGYLPIAYRDATEVIEKLGEHRFYIPGFLLLDSDGVVLASSNGESIDEYVRDRPIYLLQSIRGTDCATCPK